MRRIAGCRTSKAGLAMDELRNYLQTEYAELGPWRRGEINTLAAFQHVVAPTFGSDPISQMRTIKTTVTLDMKPLTGSAFHAAFFPSVTPLALPKMIVDDLTVKQSYGWLGGNP